MTYLTNQINLFKKSFKLDKKRFFLVMVFDLLFILVSYIALFLWSIWVSSSASRISGLELEMLTENALEELAALKSFYYGTLVCSLLLIIFLFLAWSFFQGFIWNTILKKGFNLDYFKKFLLLNLACIPLSIIIFFIAVICLGFFKSVFLFFSTTGLNTSLVMFILLILFTFILLPVMLYLVNFIWILYFYFTKKNKILDAFKNTFDIGVKKIHLLYVPCLIMSLVFVLLSAITIPFNILPAWLSSLFSLIFLIIYAAWMRFYIADFVTKSERTHHKI